MQRRGRSAQKKEEEVSIEYLFEQDQFYYYKKNDEETYILKAKNNIEKNPKLSQFDTYKSVQTEKTSTIFVKSTKKSETNVESTDFILKDQIQGIKQDKKNEEGKKVDVLIISTKKLNSVVGIKEKTTAEKRSKQAQVQKSVQKSKKKKIEEEEEVEDEDEEENEEENEEESEEEQEEIQEEEPISQRRSQRGRQKQQEQTPQKQSKEQEKTPLKKSNIKEQPVVQDKTPQKKTEKTPLKKSAVKDKTPQKKSVIKEKTPEKKEIKQTRSIKKEENEKKQIKQTQSIKKDESEKQEKQKTPKKETKSKKQPVQKKKKLESEDEDDDEKQEQQENNNITKENESSEISQQEEILKENKSVVEQLKSQKPAPKPRKPRQKKEKKVEIEDDKDESDQNTENKEENTENTQNKEENTENTENTENKEENTENQEENTDNKEENSENKEEKNDNKKPKKQGKKPAKEPKAPKAPKPPKEPKAPKPPKEKKPPKPKKEVAPFKSGKWNNKVQLQEKSEFFEGSKNEFDGSCCTFCTNKEIIRAAQTGNKELLKSLFDSNKKVSNIFQRFAPENDINAIELLVKQNDKEMLQQFVNFLKSPPVSFSYGKDKQCQLKRIDTGFNNKYAYGYVTRKVNLGRGCKEGNNALVYDLSSDNKFSQFVIQFILENCKDIETIEILYELQKTYQLQDKIQQSLAFAVRCGNYQLAADILKNAKNNVSLGFKDCHYQALTAKEIREITEVSFQTIKQKSMTKQYVTPMHLACINPNTEILKRLLEINPQGITVTDEIMRKPIHYAAVAETPANLQYLIEKNANPKELDKQSQNSPLHLAAKYGKVKNVELLLSKEDYFNRKKKNIDGNFPIHLAAQNGHLEVVKLFKENGYKLSVPGKDKMQCLHFAAANNHFELVEYIVENKGKVDCKDKLSRTPLLLAIMNNCVKIVSYLLSKGAEFNHKDSSDNHCIHYAAAYGFYECIDLLVQAGADINSLNSWNVSPLQVSIMKNHQRCTQKLLNLPNIDVNCKDDDGKSLLMLEAQELFQNQSEKFEEKLKTIDLWLEKGMDINTQDNQGNSIIHFCAENHDDYVNNKAQQDERYPPYFMKNLHVPNDMDLDDILSESEDIDDEDIMSEEYKKKQEQKEQARKDAIEAKLTENQRRENNLFTKYKEEAQKLVDADDELLKLKQEIQKIEEQEIEEEENEKKLKKLTNEHKILQQDLLRDYYTQVTNKVKNQIIDEYKQSIEVKFINIFIEKNADINLINSQGYTPLQYALQNKNYTIFKLLLDNEKTDFLTSFGLDGAYHYLSEHLCNNQMQQIYLDILEDKGNYQDFLNKIDDNGYTPILKIFNCFTVTEKNLENFTKIVKKMVEKGALINAQVEKLHQFRKGNEKQLEQEQQIQQEKDQQQNNQELEIEENKQPKELQNQQNDKIEIEEEPINKDDEKYIQKQVEIVNEKYNQDSKEYQTISKAQNTVAHFILQQQSSKYQLELLKLIEELKFDFKLSNFHNFNIFHFYLDQYQKIDLENYNYIFELEGVQETLFNKFKYDDTILHKFLSKKFEIIDQTDYSKTLDVQKKKQEFQNKHRQQIFSDLLKKTHNYIAELNLKRESPLQVMFSYINFDLIFLQEMFKYPEPMQKILSRQNLQGKTIIYQLFERNQHSIEILETLNQNNSLDQILLQDKINKETPFTWLIKFGEENKLNKNILKYILNCQYAEQLMKITNIDNKTPLQLFIERNIYLIELLPLFLQKINKNLEILNNVDVNGKTALHSFIDLQEQKIIIPTFSLLVENGADTLQEYQPINREQFLNQKLQQSIPPVILALNQQKYKFIKVMVEKGKANLNICHPTYGIPLIQAIKKQNEDDIDLLIKLKADPNFLDSQQRNSLHYAVSANSINCDFSFEIEKSLLNFGAKVLQDSKGRTPLHYYFLKIGKNQEDIINDTSSFDPQEGVESFCATSNANINMVDYLQKTALHYAARRNAAMSSRYLISKGANINAKDKLGNTPLGFAFLTQNQEVATILIENKADINTKFIVKGTKKREITPEDEEYNKTVDLFTYSPVFKDGEYSLFSMCIENNWQGICFLLIEYGYNILDAIFVSFQKQKFNLYRSLYQQNKHKQEVFKTHDSSMNLVHIFAIKGKFMDDKMFDTMWAQLETSGIQLDMQDKDGKTPFIYAIENQFFKLFDILMDKHKVNINIQDKDGKTPLIHALIVKNSNLVQKLLNHPNIDLKLCDKQKRSIIHYMASNYTHKQNIKRFTYENYVEIKDDQKIIDMILQEQQDELERLKPIKKDENYDDEEQYQYQRDQFHKAFPIHIPFSNSATNARGTESFYENQKQYQKQKNQNQENWVENRKQQFQDSISQAQFLQLIQKLPIEFINLQDANGRTALQNSVFNDNEFVTKKLSKQKNIDIYAQDINGYTAISTAIRYHYRQLNYIKEYYNKEIDFTQKTKNNETCLHIAAYKGSLDIFEQIKNQIDVNSLDVNNQTPLIIAIKQKQTEFYLKLFQKSNIIVNTQDNQQNTPLHIAVLNKDIQAVHYLLNYGSQVHKKNKNYQTPLNIALGTKQYLIAAKLICNEQEKVNLLDDFVTIKEQRQLKIKAEEQTPVLQEQEYQNYLKSTPILKQKEFIRKIIKIEEKSIKEYIGEGENKKPIFVPYKFIDVNIFTVYPVLQYCIDILKIQDNYKKLTSDQNYSEENEFLENINKNNNINNNNIFMGIFGNQNQKQQQQQQQISNSFKYDTQYDPKLDTPKALNLLEILVKRGGSPLECSLNTDDCLLIQSIVQNETDIAVILAKSENLDTQKFYNTYKKTALHYVVNPLKYGSYENETILKALLPKFDVKQKDQNGKTIADLAFLQDSGKLLKVIEEYGGQVNKLSLLKRGGTSVITLANWPEEEIDFDTDSKQYIGQVQKINNISEEHVPVCDYRARGSGIGSQDGIEILKDEEAGYYDLLMAKVDVRQGQYGQNVFYKMQLLHSSARNTFFVFTNWGRVGDPGQHQCTPFNKQDEAEKLFIKIFKEKCGNDWKTRKTTYERKQGKYNLLKRVSKIEYDKYIETFDFEKMEENKKLKQTKLPKQNVKVIKQITNLDQVRRQYQRCNVNKDLFQIDKSEIHNAMNILVEIKDMIKELEENKKNLLNTDINLIFELQDKISDKTSDYYHLIPDSNRVNQVLPPFTSIDEVDDKLQNLKNILDFEVTSKIILGAHFQYETKNIHPIDYYFNSLNIRMLPLEREHEEFLLIQKYINATSQQSKIKNIFAIERKGEAQRISQYKHLENRKLLWHGTSGYNLMSILCHGLVPSFLGRGGLFGSGLYFSDDFTKAYSYSGNWNGSTGKKSKNYRYLLLCEVALGEMKVLNYYEALENLEAPYMSIKGQARQEPNKKQDVILANGAIVPTGKYVTVPTGQCSKNEYIVKKESQVRIRYLIQMKD